MKHHLTEWHRSSEHRCWRHDNTLLLPLKLMTSRSIIRMRRTQHLVKLFEKRCSKLNHVLNSSGRGRDREQFQTLHGCNIEVLGEVDAGGCAVVCTGMQWHREDQTVNPGNDPGNRDVTWRSEMEMVHIILPDTLSRYSSRIQPVLNVVKVVCIKYLAWTIRHSAVFYYVCGWPLACSHSGPIGYFGLSLDLNYNFKSRFTL